MSKKMLIDATHPEETRVVVVDGSKVEDFDFESVNKRQLAGNIYLAKVTRVEPSLQAAFVEYGGNRHGFLAFAEIHPDYYQIPVADREALLAAEEADNRAADAEEERPARANARPPRRRARRDGAPRESAEAAAEGAEVEGALAEGAGVEAPPAEASAAGPADDAISADAAADEAPTGAGPEADMAEPPAPDQSGDEGDAPPRAMAESSGADGAERVAEDYAPDAAAESAAEASGAAAPAEGEADAGAPKRPRRARRPRARRKADAPEAGEAETAQADAGAAEAAPSESEPGAEVVAEAAAPAQRLRVEEPAEDAVEPVESVGAESVEDEVRPRRPMLRRYKIQEVIKVRQIMLVQVVKEERGNKGAALTTYLSLAGRYCVLMPNTARGGGISRKITSAEDRKKLKEIASEFEVPKGMGLIIRTAGAQRTRAEIKRDYEYLLRQWDQIRELTLKSIAPTLIYEEGSLIKRSIRDIYAKDIDEVLVAGEDGYREAKDYMRMLMPSHAKAVQPYRDAVPLFSRFQVESYLAGMFNPTVQLRSGGYIVIGVTEALVAIDVNSGRSTREGSIEETALKTNLEAADEIARQLRLRDLAGLIVIDFIDMDERRNNAAVEKRMKERLKNDRARIQMGRISAFGLMELSRQRLRPGMIEASTAPCPHCHGTGLIRSADSLALSILREIEEEGVRARAREIKVVAPVQIANYLINQKREHVLAVEARYGMSVLIEGDPALISPEHRIERAKTPSRALPAPTAAIRAETGFAALEDPREPEDDEADDAPEAVAEPPRRREPRDGRDRGVRPAEARHGEPRHGEPRQGAEPRPDSGEADRDSAKARRRRGKRGGKKRRRDGEEGGAPGAADPMPVLGGDGAHAAPMSISRSPFGEEIGDEEIAVGEADAGESGRVDSGETARTVEPPVEAPAAAPVEPEARIDIAAAAAAEPVTVAEDMTEAAHPSAADPAPQAEDAPVMAASPVAGTAAPERGAAAPPAPPRPPRTGWFSRSR